VIADFSKTDGDKLDLSAWDAKPGLAGVQPWSFVASFSGVPGQIRFDAANHLALFDQNGDKQADAQIELTGVAALSASDFVLA
jgi:serralysin